MAFAEDMSPEIFDPSKFGEELTFFERIEERLSPSFVVPLDDPLGAGRARACAE